MSFIQSVFAVLFYTFIYTKSSLQDMSDLFGCDLPSEDGSGFCWRDGPLLKALKLGNWVLLDEMNLASQAVLEGMKSFM